MRRRRKRGNTWRRKIAYRYGGCLCFSAVRERFGNAVAGENSGEGEGERERGFTEDDFFVGRKRRTTVVRRQWRLLEMSSTSLLIGDTGGRLCR